MNITRKSVLRTLFRGSSDHPLIPPELRDDYDQLLIVVDEFVEKVIASQNEVEDGN